MHLLSSDKIFFSMAIWCKCVKCRSSHFQSEGGGVKSLRTGEGVKNFRTGGGYLFGGGVAFAGEEVSTPLHAMSLMFRQ